eukprot:10888751-Alexandrium_andersonii.AAC.1
MSASLVGSEMCIRDSQRPAAKARRAGVVEKLDPPQRWPLSLHRWVVPVCLLYTSDAADDM